MKILGLHDGSGCGYYRVVLPLGELAKHGHDVKLADSGTAGTMAEAGSWPLIVGQRLDRADAIPAWRKLGARSRLVYDVDDDLFHVSPLNWQSYAVYSQPETRAAIAAFAGSADIVTVTTPPLAEVMREHNPNVVVLPEYVPGWVCDLPRDRDRPLTVGWAGGLSHGHDIAGIAGQVRGFLDRHPAWQMRMLGADYRPFIRHDRAVFSPYVPVMNNPEAYYRSIDWDIGLAPLAGGVFNRSKCHIKVLEYAARGIPVLASDCEAFRDFVVDGVTGFLIREPGDWLKRLDELANDDAMRTEMGAAARERARAYAIEDHWQEWADVYEKVLGVMDEPDRQAEEEPPGGLLGYVTVTATAEVTKAADIKDDKDGDVTDG